MRGQIREIYQIAALPLFWRPDGGADVCLVTSRGSGRWIIPKGNPIKGLRHHEVAAREALEEAGLIGAVEEEPVSRLRVERQRGKTRTIVSLDVFVLIVSEQLRKWREKDQRSVLRCDFATAVSLVSCPKLAELIGHQGSAGRGSMASLLESRLAS